MVATIPYNPQATTVALGAFDTTSIGLVQGDYYPDPAIIFERTSGVLSQNETIPAWGGMAIYEQIPGGGSAKPSVTLGTTVGRATGLANYGGFSVWSYGMINSPQSPVPLAASGMQVQYFRKGSGMRVIVQADPNLATELPGEYTNANVSWDWQNQLLVPYASTTISSSTVYQGGALTGTGTYNPATGAVSLTTTNAHGLEVGDTFTVAITAGTGSFAALAGTFIAGAGTTAETLNYTAATGLPATTVTAGSLTTNAVSMTTAAASGLEQGDTFEIDTATGANSFAKFNGEQTAAQGSTGTTLRFLTNAVLVASTTLTGGNITTGGILPVTVLDIVATNCMTVNYNSQTGFASWNFNGCCAVIQI